MITKFKLFEGNENDLKKWISALSENNYVKIESMLKKGFDVNYHFRENLKSTNSLFYALFYESYDVVKILIKYGIDLEEIDPTNNTYILSTLIIKNYITTTKCCKETQMRQIFNIFKNLINTVDINKQDLEGYTSLMRAASYQQNHFIYLLIKAGADWNIKNNDGKDFMDIIGNWSGLIKKFPDQYKEYLKKKTIKKFKI